MSEKKNEMTLMDQLPAGAKAFHAAVADKLTKDVWAEILEAQVKKAREGDRGAAKFLLEYAGGVASMRGATFVQENHTHEHYHEPKAAPKLTNSKIVDPDDVPERTPDDFAAERERRARRVVNELNGRS